MKHKWDREKCIDGRRRTERGGIMWLEAGIYKLRGIMTGFERRRRRLCSVEQNAKHILLICSERNKSREGNLYVVNVSV